jgi:virulence-associated protein VapD
VLCLQSIEALKRIDWFKKSVRDISVFRVEDWSDFTSVVKEVDSRKNLLLAYSQV